ncbi:hypothetical protein PROFUN_14505, partial [Planoprotostelium fungivorum]
FYYARAQISHPLWSHSTKSHQSALLQYTTQPYMIWVEAFFSANLDMLWLSNGGLLQRDWPTGSDHWCHAARQGGVSNQLGHWSCPTANPKLEARPQNNNFGAKFTSQDLLRLFTCQRIVPSYTKTSLLGFLSRLYVNSLIDANRLHKRLLDLTPNSQQRLTCLNTPPPSRRRKNQTKESLLINIIEQTSRNRMLTAPTIQDDVEYAQITFQDRLVRPSVRMVHKYVTASLAVSNKTPLTSTAYGDNQSYLNGVVYSHEVRLSFFWYADPVDDYKHHYVQRVHYNFEILINMFGVIPTLISESCINSIRNVVNTKSSESKRRAEECL